MPVVLSFLIGLAASYFLGAIPTAYIAGRLFKGIDIRLYGSGNVGATNAFRTLGKGPGLAVFAIDIVKGVLPTVLVADILGLDQVFYRILFGLTAVAGHNWTVFLQFKGGKGVATSLGLLIGLAVKIEGVRVVLGVCLLVWGGVFLTTGFVSLSSLITSLLLPVLMALTNQSLELIALGVVICLFVFVRHRANIKRLMSGQESKSSLFSRRK